MLFWGGGGGTVEVKSLGKYKNFSYITLLIFFILKFESPFES